MSPNQCFIEFYFLKNNSVDEICSLLYVKKILFIYLAVPGPHCSMQILSCGMWDLVIVH